MILIESLYITTSSATGVDVVVHYNSSTAGIGSYNRSQQTRITSVGDTSILSTPVAPTSNRVKVISIKNTDASVSNTVVVYKNDGTNSYKIIKSIAIPAGYELQYNEGKGFVMVDTTGKIVGTSSSVADITRMNISNVVQVNNEDIVAVAGTAYYYPAGGLTSDHSINLSNLNIEGDYIEIAAAESRFTIKLVGAIEDYYNETYAAVNWNQKTAIRLVKGTLRIFN
jgi:hypothetical protein